MLLSVSAVNQLIYLTLRLIILLQIGGFVFVRQWCSEKKTPNPVQSCCYTIMQLTCYKLQSRSLVDRITVSVDRWYVSCTYSLHTAEGGRGLCREEAPVQIPLQTCVMLSQWQHFLTLVKNTFHDFLWTLKISGNSEMCFLIFARTFKYIFV